MARTTVSPHPNQDPSITVNNATPDHKIKKDTIENKEDIILSPEAERTPLERSHYQIKIWELEEEIWNLKEDQAMRKKEYFSQIADLTQLWSVDK